MKPISELTKKELKKIKLIVFDVDGVLVPRGTKIKQVGNTTTFETKKIPKPLIKQIKDLKDKGFHININSGRGLYMLEDMFREILDSVSITYENGSASWINGKVIQHINSFKQLDSVLPKLQEVKHKNIKGFEPKEFIITIHCTNRVKKIEKIIDSEKNLYYIWNDEAYDIGIKKTQTKLIGLKKLMKHFKLSKGQVLAIGDNYNDKELLSGVGIKITADKSRLKGDYYVDLSKKNLPAGQLMNQILKQTN
tara:strand:- start:124 stop:876 length:753 start_codon:yes stop_codon:yes gene_type:complete